jgi:acid stress chaperone HdeA
MNARRIAAVIAAAVSTISLALPASEAAPARKSLAYMTCADFLAYDDAAKPQMVYWAAIHERGGRLPTGVIDVNDTDRIVPVLVDKCRTAPQDSFWQKVRTETSMFRREASEQRPDRTRAD